eukprot:9638290-Lingulodinium_polyedra.AAC.1
MGFRRSLLEPCWWVKSDASGQLEGMVFLEVDDLLWGLRSAKCKAMEEAARARFTFGKWVPGEG